MKLTNTLRDAFVRAAMGDVPSIDYQEQAEKLLCAEAADSLPPKVRAVYDDPKLRGYLETKQYICMPGGLQGRYAYAADRFKVSPELQSALEALAAQLKAQDGQRRDLEGKLRGAAYAVTTRKALVELLPEFEKYLPEEPEKGRQLPMIANLVADFAKAGWPKGTVAA